MFTFLINTLLVGYSYLKFDYQNFERFKIQYNLFHLFHAILCVTNYLSGRFIVNTTGPFFLVDTLKLCYEYFYQLKKDRLTFILHHIISLFALYLISQNYLSEEIQTVFYLLELSNISLYINYHIIKMHRYNNSLKIASLTFQVIWYSYYRIYEFGKFIMDNFDKFIDNKILVIFTLYIYLLGIVWSLILVRKWINKLF